ncbi:MAG: response regulator transcription factor [Ardenticatenaceae bacterium]|nr:response regulator transcription factor [Anaerolineales bacterium]MCB9005962.1 response regulator transcription factor [Ardenticatenaceae bacterium]
MPITVVSIDDHPLIHAAIRSLFEDQENIRLVAEGLAGEHVLPLVEKHQPDVLILDLDMPQIENMPSGGKFPVLQTVAQLSQDFPETAVIFLTQHATHSMSQQAIRLGVRGYLLKSDDLSMNLPGAIEAVHRGGVYFSKEISQMLFQPIQPLATEPILTERQKEIILAIAQSPDATYRQLAAELSISESTFKGHLNNAFKALDVTNITACIITCMQRRLISFSIDELGRIRFGSGIEAF